MQYETIDLSIDQGIGRLRLCRPEALNALSMQMLVELRDALKRVGGSPAVRCLVLSGEGRGFCTGVDLKAPRPGLNLDDPDEFLRDYFMPPYQILAALDIPTIAVVNGPAAGAGMSLALSCDIVLAAESAYFLQPFTNIGLVPDLGSSWLLPHLVGLARATGLMLLGDRLPARTASEWGLIWKCVADDALEREASHMAGQFAAGASQALAMTKQLLREAYRNDLRQQMQREVAFQRACLHSPDAQEARRAFAERRKPVFGMRQAA